jgi:hypothetical protein
MSQGGKGADGIPVGPRLIRQICGDLDVTPSGALVQREFVRISMSQGIQHVICERQIVCRARRICGGLNVALQNIEKFEQEWFRLRKPAKKF